MRAAIQSKQINWGTEHDQKLRTDEQSSKLAGAGAAMAGLSIPHIAHAQANELVIAYNVNLPSWDPTTGPSAVNPTIQGIYQSVFDQFILQKPDLSLAPGLLTEWGFSDDLKTGAHDGARGRDLA